MNKAEAYKSLTEEDKHFLHCIAQDIAMLFSTSDKYISAAKKIKHFRKKLTEFAKKWEIHNSVYKASRKGKWSPSMGKPINPLGTIWPDVYGVKWEDSTGPKRSPRGRIRFPFSHPRDMQLLGDYVLLGVIHDKVLTNRPSISKGFLPDKLIKLIWQNLITDVGIEDWISHRAIIHEDKIKACLSHITSDIEMLSKEIAAAAASGLESSGITPPIMKDFVLAGQQKSAETEPQEKGGQSNDDKMRETIQVTPKTDSTLIYQADAETFYNIPKSTLSKASNKKPGEPGYLWSGRKGKRVFYRKSDCNKLAKSRTKLRNV